MSESRYVWWPAYQPTSIDLVDPRQISSHLLMVGALIAVLCIPTVSRATSISAPAVLGIIGVHLVWFLFSALVLARGVVSERRANALLIGNLLVNCSVVVAIPVATGDPRTPLWMLPVLYACLNGAMQERKRCVAFLLALVAAPLVGMVVLLTAEVVTTWSIAAPVLCAALCGVSYNHLASVSARWRELRNTQNAALAAARAQIAVRDRERMLGDLSDSINSTFSIVAMYGDLIDEHVDRPDVLRALAAMVRDAARSGLGDLRGVLGAMSSTSADVAGLASTLTLGGARAAEGSPLEVSVAITEGAQFAVTAPLRLTIVRTFQQELRGARGATSGSRVDARLASDGRTLTFEITGAMVGAAWDRDMRERVSELGGTFVRTPLPMSGATVRVSLPHAS